MKKIFVNLSVGGLLIWFGCGTLHAQSAKSIFDDPTSGTAIASSATAASPNSGNPGSGPKTGSAKLNRPWAVPGLNFWLEELMPGGEVKRVSTSQQFHTGDRIRLHLRSNMPGYLEIVTQQSGEAAELLFPSAKIKDNKVERLQTKVFPSSTAWFKFDDRPGELRLTLSLTGARQGVAAPPVEAPPTLIAEADRAMSDKGLKIEEDPSPNTGSVHAVKLGQPASGPAKISLHVRLHHVQ
jgi:hypothetical protein